MGAQHLVYGTVYSCLRFPPDSASKRLVCASAELPIFCIDIRIPACICKKHLDETRTHQLAYPRTNSYSQAANASKFLAVLAKLLRDANVQDLADCLAAFPTYYATIGDASAHAAYSAGWEQWRKVRVHLKYCAV